MTATMDSLLEPLAPWLDQPAIEDVCIQEPGVVWCFAQGKFTRYEVPDLGKDEIDDIAIVAGAQRRRDFGHDKPLLGIDVPYKDTLRRLHAVAEPHVDGCTHMVLRQGSREWPTMEQLREQGLFRKTKRQGERQRSQVDEQLAALYRSGDTFEFLRFAAAHRRTIVIAGVNGSGKTHLSKALIGEIPLFRRLIIIENARELQGVPHPNKVCFYYAKDDENGLKPIDLVDAALRMRTEQLFLQELRDGHECLAFLMAGQTGHRGAITTIHAGSCEEVNDRIKAALKMTDSGRGWSNEDITFTLNSTIDVIVHQARDEIGGDFGVDEILYNQPAYMGQELALPTAYAA